MKKDITYYKITGDDDILETGHFIELANVYYSPYIYEKYLLSLFEGTRFFKLNYPFGIILPGSKLMICSGYELLHYISYLNDYIYPIESTPTTNYKAFDTSIGMKTLYNIFTLNGIRERTELIEFIDKVITKPIFKSIFDYFLYDKNKNFIFADLDKYWTLLLTQLTKPEPIDLRNLLQLTDEEIFIKNDEYVNASSNSEGPTTENLNGTMNNLLQAFGTKNKISRPKKQEFDKFQKRIRGFM